MDQRAAAAPRATANHEVFTLGGTGEPPSRIMRRPRPEGESSGERPDPDRDYEVLSDVAHLDFNDHATLGIAAILLDGSHDTVGRFGQGDLNIRVPPLEAPTIAARAQATTSCGLSVSFRRRPRADLAEGRSGSRDSTTDAAILVMLLDPTHGPSSVAGLDPRQRASKSHHAPGMCVRDRFRGAGQKP